MTLLQTISWTILEHLISFFPDMYKTQRFRGDIYTLLHYGSRKRLTLGPRAVISGSEMLFIGNDVLIAAGVWINSFGNITIGDRSMIGPHTIIDSCVHDKASQDKRASLKKGEIHIGADVWIGGNCTINCGTDIGKGTTIGSQSFVKGNIPEYVFAAGVPCKVKLQLNRPSGFPKE